MTHTRPPARAGTGTDPPPPGPGAGARPWLSVVTLLWRNEAHVPAFVTSLARSANAAGAVVELIALENGPDGRAAAAALAAATPVGGLTVRLLTRPVNLGFAGGMNEGGARAGGAVIVLANLDLEFDEGFVAGLARWVPAERGAVLVAPSVRSPGTAGAAGEQGAARIGALHRLRTARPAPGRAGEVVAGNGSCMILTRDLRDRRAASTGGIFDPEYHSFYEDLDLFWWARDNGIAVLFDPGLRVVHHKAGSFAGRFRFGDRTPDIQASVMANYRLTVWKHASGPVQLAAWVAGEAGYAAWCARAAGMAGMRPYLRSWVLAVGRARAIRRRRGRLRDAPVPAGGR